ncbi:MAG: glycosyltransferase family protein [Solirubrobacteraceae bacterium]
MPESKPPAAPPELRVAFVGQGVYFAQCSLEQPADGVNPTFLDFRAMAPPEPLIAKLRELNPDVVLVFRPEIIPEGLFEPLRAVKIGYLTEPLPRGRDSNHPDLLSRMRDPEAVDPDNFDRIVSFDPLIADTAGSVLPVWQSLAIPVADSLFLDPPERAHPPRLLFVGRSTEHREELLAPVKQNHPIVHIGHGLFGERLTRFLRHTDVQLNLHNNPYPSFENRVCMALAAGQLVISEPLSPNHGLEPGVHYLEIETPRQLLALVDELMANPDAFIDVQHAGRRQAESFRASRVYPQLMRDALGDLKRSGYTQTPARQPADHGSSGRTDARLDTALP